MLSKLVVGRGSKINLGYEHGELMSPFKFEYVILESYIYRTISILVYIFFLLIGPYPLINLPKLLGLFENDFQIMTHFNVGR